jgi:hypothetical protein
MFSRYSFLALYVALFNLFLSLRQFYLPSSVLTFFHFFLSSIILIIFCVIYGVLALFSTFLTRSLRVSKTHFFIFFHCTSTFPLSHSITMPCVNSHTPCRAPELLQECRVLRKSPRDSRKHPNC